MSRKQYAKILNSNELGIGKKRAAFIYISKSYADIISKKFELLITNSEGAKLEVHFNNVLYELTITKRPERNECRIYLNKELESVCKVGDVLILNLEQDCLHMFLYSAKQDKQLNIQGSFMIDESRLIYDDFLQYMKKIYKGKSTYASYKCACEEFHKFLTQETYDLKGTNKEEVKGLLSGESIKWNYNADGHIVSSYKSYIEENYLWVKNGFQGQWFDFTRDELISLKQALSNDNLLNSINKSYGNCALSAALGVMIKFMEDATNEKSWIDLNQHNLDNSFIHDFPQRLIQGPPGTGKSYQINQELKNKSIIDLRTIRMVCHPESTNAQFIGSYRPQSNAGQITYDFSEGPFTKLLKRALNDLSQPYVLVIEELNRANSAAMFAEAFQLLDRDTEGWSVHPTDLGDDVHKYLELEKDESVRLPPNFAIWATMNTADQGVFPMDTAFKRRWSFEYLGVNEGKETWNKEPWNPQVFEQDDLTWQALRHYINTLLEAQGVDEDRQLGGFFLSEAELSDKDKLLEHIINKVIGYLRDDVMRYEPEKLFKAVEGGTRAPSFSQLRATLLKTKTGDDFMKIFAEADGKEHTVDRVRELYTSIDTHQLNEAEATQPTAQHEEPTSESLTSEQPEG